MKEYSNSVPELPTDILIDVFYRLPVKTLVRFSCACKFWKDLILSDRIFIGCHLKQSLKKTNKSSSNVLFYTMWDINHPSDIHLRRITNADENCLRKSFFLEYAVYLVGCINGVFCLCRHRSNDIYLWNPALHQLRMIRDCMDWYCGSFFNVVSFFYDPTNDDYIVVKIFPKSVFIYKLSINCWEKTEFPYNPSAKDIGIKDKVALAHNGALHWLSTSKRRNGLFLNVYHLTRKTFQQSLVTDRIPIEPTDANLGLRKGCLCLFGRSTTDDRFWVWMMKEYGLDNSWTKQFEVQSYIIPQNCLSSTSGKFLCLSSTSGKFLTKQGKYVVLYDPERGKIEFAQEEAVLYDPDKTYFFTDNYVESLVSVLPPVKRTTGCFSFLETLRDCWSLY